MPCYHCGTRQIDPDRGESPWKRGVRGDRQVLICPGCQASFDWTSDLDRCPVCSSVHLVRRLGEVECRDCGFVRQSATSSLPGHLAGVSSGARGDTGLTLGAGEPGGPADGGSAGGPAADRVGPDIEAADMQGLAQEVELALARVLGRTAGSAASG
jgi:hypothetical protein